MATNGQMRCRIYKPFESLAATALHSSCLKSDSPASAPTRIGGQKESLPATLCVRGWVQETPIPESFFVASESRHKDAMKRLNRVVCHEYLVEVCELSCICV